MVRKDLLPFETLSIPGALLVADPMLQTPNDYNATPFGHIHSFLPSLAQISFLGHRQHAILVGGDNRLKTGIAADE
jgi:hypothetical protein